MKRSVLLAAALVASLVVAAPGAGAQTVEPQDEFLAATIDSDQVTDRIGLVDPVTGIWNIRGAGGAVNSFFYGNPGDFPFVGDWDCDGVDTPGLYRQSDGFVYLRNSNTQGIADIRFFFGNPGDVPLAGDFNGDGCDTVSIYRPAEARIYVINALGANDGGLGAAEFSYIFGNPGDKPFVGDFNGDRIDTVGLHRESTGFVYFRQSHTQGIADSEFFYGIPDDRLVAGDWGIVDDVDTPAIFRPSIGRFFFRYTNTQGNADEELVFGEFRMLPVAGAWTVKLGLAGTLAKATIGIPYAQQLGPVGGTPPYTVQKTSGPAWVSLNNAGVVSGTPTDLGSFNIGVTVTDSKGLTVNQVVPLTVQDGCDTNTTIPDAQCLALVALFRTTNGNGWTNKANWFSTDPCQWFGVTCGGANVTSVVLEENNLTGTLPTELGSLTGLQILNLQHHLMSGLIPTQLGGLQTLQVLDLSGGNLTGPIPNFTLPANLIELDLAENNLTGGIPAGVAAETSLTLLDLASNNTLGGTLPTELGNLVNLQILDLSENGITGTIPTQIGNLVNLQSLNLSQNGLTGTVPPSLGSPPAKPLLAELDLSENALGGALPDSLIGLTGIQPALGFLTLCGNGDTLLFSASAGLVTYLTPRDPAWQATTCP